VSVEATEAKAEQLEAGSRQHAAPEGRDGGQAERGHSCPSDWPSPIRALARVSRVLSIVEGVGIIVCLVGVVLLSTWQFTERNLVQRHHWFFAVPAWSDGVIRHSVFLLGFLGGAYATFTARHIRIDAVTRILGLRSRIVLRVVTTLAALAIVTLFTWAGWGFYKITLEEAGEASQAGQLFTSSRGAMIMVLGYGVVAFHFLVQIAIDIGWLVSKRPIPPTYIAEASAH
jgi:TRAP-type C4-dicarboxylate transport system permease small subunit